jgi:hypothetical protein
MDTLKILPVLILAIAGGINSFQSQPASQPTDNGTILVVERPAFEQAATEDIPTPVGSSETDELREIAKELTADAARLKVAAEEQRKAAEGFGSFRPDPSGYNANECDCGCDGLTEEDVRRIAADEYQIQRQVDFQQMRGVQSGNSSGGAVSMTAGNYQSSGGGLQSTSSSGYYGSGSTGGSVFESVPPTNVRARDRIASRFATPFKNFAGTKVTIHTFADGSHCPACESWKTNVAPKLQADGVMVTQIADIQSGSAPIIDVCKDSESCVRLKGAASYSQIISVLR